MRGFYWLIEGELAGCARPGGRAMFSGYSALDAQAALEVDLAWLRERGIAAVLSLTEAPLEAEALAHHELEALHLPIADMTAPTPEQLEHALGFVDRQRALGRAVVVHCLAGQGRTGTVLAAYLIRGGMSPEEALGALRAVCPGAVENAAQERALHAFAARRDWIA
jgi:atypical dual specificity phosphatase